MSKQNIYNDPVFFQHFLETRQQEANYNDLIETPTLHALLPSLVGKKVLDMGCGMGQHAHAYAEMGTASVLGIDLSEKMLAIARRDHALENIRYQQLAMEDLASLADSFDVITSSLVFDYIEDLEALFSDVAQLLIEGGEFVFSMSHPISTAYTGQFPRFTEDKTGKRIYANLNDYNQEGLRKITWAVDNHELYHHTLSTIINALASNGFHIEACRESFIPEDLLQAYPELFNGKQHRPDFIFFKCRK